MEVYSQSLSSSSYTVKRSSFPDLKILIFLLTIISVSNAFWERLLPFELDIIIATLILIGFLGVLAVKKYNFKRSVLDKPILILLSAMLITLVTLILRGSTYIGESAVQFVRFAMVMGLSLVLIQILDDTSSIQKVLKYFTITSAFISLLTEVGLFLGISSVRILGLEIILFRPWGGIQARLGGIYEQPNTFATPLVLAVTLGIVFALLSKKVIQRIFWSGISIICFGGLLLSQSRSAILGASISVLIMIALFIKLRKSSKFLSTILLIIIGIMGILVKTQMLDPVLTRLSLNYNIYQQFEHSEVNRLDFWRESLKLAIHNPFGYGAETKYLIGGVLGFERKSVHNLFFSSLTSMGVLGFIGMLILVISPILKLWKFIQTTEEKSLQLLGIGLFGGLVGLWIHNFFHSFLHWMAIWIYFACIASMLNYKRIS